MVKVPKHWKYEKPNHYRHPLRRIVKLERQGKLWWVVLECKHASPGRPKDPRRARFYPCPVCYEHVRAAKMAYKQPTPDLMTAFRSKLRKTLKGGTFR